MSAEKKSYTYKEASEATGKGVRSIRQLVYDGVLKAKKDGRRVLILGSSLDAYLDNLPDYID